MPSVEDCLQQIAMSIDELREAVDRNTTCSHRLGYRRARDKAIRKIYARASSLENVTVASGAALLRELADSMLSMSPDDLG